MTHLLATGCGRCGHLMAGRPAPVACSECGERIDGVGPRAELRMDLGIDETTRMTLRPRAWVEVLGEGWSSLRAERITTSLLDLFAGPDHRPASDQSQQAMTSTPARDSTKRPLRSEE